MKIYTWEYCKEVYEKQIEDGFPSKFSANTVPSGYRDVVWCPYANEPTFLTPGKKGGVDCPMCNENFEPETHAFLLHILKPR